jgi:hypothetical protein
MRPLRDPAVIFAKRAQGGKRKLHDAPNNVPMILRMIRAKMNPGCTGRATLSPFSSVTTH